MTRQQCLRMCTVLCILMLVTGIDFSVSAQTKKEQMVSSDQLKRSKLLSQNLPSAQYEKVQQKIAQLEQKQRIYKKLLTDIQGQYDGMDEIIRQQKTLILLRQIDELNQKLQPTEKS